MYVCMFSHKNTYLRISVTFFSTSTPQQWAYSQAFSRWSLAGFLDVKCVSKWWTDRTSWAHAITDAFLGRWQHLLLVMGSSPIGHPERLLRVASFEVHIGYMVWGVGSRSKEACWVFLKLHWQEDSLGVGGMNDSTLYFPRLHSCFPVVWPPCSQSLPDRPARAVTGLAVMALFSRLALKVIKKSPRRVALPKIYAETAQKFSVLGRSSKSLLKTFRLKFILQALTTTIVWILKEL